MIMRKLLCILVHFGAVNAICNICGPGMMIGDEEGVVEIPGRENRTCLELQDIADSDMVTDDQCKELTPLVLIPCGCIEYSCNICGDGGVSTDPAGIIDIPGDSEGLTTCAAVNAVAKAGGFNESFCPTVQAIAEDPCGCTQGSLEPTASPGDEETISPAPTRSPVSRPATREPTPPDFSSAENSCWISMAMGVTAAHLLFISFVY